LIAVPMVAFAILDVRELFHQIDESHAGIAEIAGAVAALHAAAAGLALRLSGASAA
jgi:hypothetical protein